jgi:hypothetical protein
VKPQAQFLTELAHLLVPLTDISEAELLELLQNRAATVAAHRELPSSQEALSKAAAKRDRKAAKLEKVFGGSR